MIDLIKRGIKHPKTILIIYAVLIVISIISYPKIEVNYNINDYLPKKSESTVSLNKMKEEYDELIPNLRVMLEDVTINETLDMIKKIEDVPGVQNVVWLDDFESVMKPMAFMDAENLENYYKNNNALMNITVQEDSIISATEEIRKIIGDDNKMTGSAVNTAIATTNSVSEIRVVTIVGVLFTILILILTTESWIEPVIILIGLLVSIVINAGTNLIFGEISFVTNAAGNILLLAVSLDYTVFVLHRYKEEKKNYDDHVMAMGKALEVSFSSILSSALTTIIGFLALIFMQFRIGPDLGLALAKGVFISLVTEFTLMPIVILKMDNLIEKTEHKKFVPSFKKFGEFVLKHKNANLVIFFIIMIPCFLASKNNAYYFGNSHIYGVDTKLGSDTVAIENEFGKSDTYVLLLPKGDLEKERKLSSDLKNIDEVSNIISYVDTVGETIPENFIDGDSLKKLNSKNYTRMIVSVNADYEGEDTIKLIEKVKETANRYYGDNYYLAGEGISTYDLKNTVMDDMNVVNIIAIVAVFLVLLLSKKSLLIPVILVSAIETAIFINMSVPYFRSTTIFYIAYLIISSIQLGATVDYAILLTERYCEMRETLDRRDSIKTTLEKVSVSILTSALTMIIVGFLLGKFSTHGLISQLGYLLSVGTTASVIIVLFVLPGLLYMFDGLIQKTTKNINFINER